MYQGVVGVAWSSGNKLVLEQGHFGLTLKQFLTLSQTHTMPVTIEVERKNKHAKDKKKMQ